MCLQVCLKTLAQIFQDHTGGMKVCFGNIHQHHGYKSRGNPACVLQPFGRFNQNTKPCSASWRNLQHISANGRVVAQVGAPLGDFRQFAETVTGRM